MEEALRAPSQSIGQGEMHCMVHAVVLVKRQIYQDNCGA